MIDFLRANPWCSREEYTWRLTVPQVRLASFDFSHTDYSHKEKKTDNGVQVIESIEDLKNLTDQGTTII